MSSTSTGDYRQGQFPDDNGNGRVRHDRVNGRVYGFDGPDGPVARLLTTGDFHGPHELPRDAETWRWHPSAVESLWDGELQQIQLSLVYDPRLWEKHEAHEAFFESTRNWLSWTCGRLFEIGESQWLTTSREKGTFLFRLKSPDYDKGPTHLLALSLDPENPLDEAPEAHIYLDVRSLHAYLDEREITMEDFDKNDAVVGVDRGSLHLVEGEEVEAILLDPVRIESGDCVARP